MIRHTLNKQRRAQLAIMLSLLFFAPIGVQNCWGQAAGFAQSRKEAPASAESGPRRSLLSQLNPFSRQSEQAPPIVDTTTISQPVATNLPSNAFASSPTQTPMPVQAQPRPATQVQIHAQPQTSTTAAPAQARPLNASTPSASAVRTGLAGRPASVGKGLASAKSSSTGGVASLLLDELEDEDEDIEIHVSKKPEKKASRHSLRVDSFPSSLELLDEDGDSETVEEDEPVRSKGRDKGEGFVSTDDEDFDEEEVEDEEESDDELEDEESAPLVAVVVENQPEPKKSSKTQKKSPKTRKSLQTIDEIETLSDAEADEQSEVEVKDEDVAVLDNRLEDNAKSPVKETPARMNSVTAPVDVVDNSDSDAAISLGRTPNIEVNTVGSRKVTVGQSTSYTIHVKNVGSEVARKLVVTTEIPDSVVDLRSKPSVGEASFQNIDGHVSRKCEWKVGVLGPGEEQTLVLTMTPTKRASFGLASSFDFERSSALAEVEVQEPILEALIEGRDSIEWGVEDRYRLRLRNIGNGDAENVTLHVSTEENQATQLIGLLRSGEEKTIEMSVKTVSDDFFTIDVHAVGAYGIEAKATKKVATLRGNLSVAVEAPELQFVDGEFEAVVHVRNNGNATLQNVDVVAQLPEGVEALSCSNQARRNDDKRRVYWVAPFIRPNEETTFTISCRVKSAGSAKFEAVAVDQSGLVAQARSLMNVESIAVLAMRINAPKEPVAVGKTCVYELVVENNGTKDAHDINSGVFLGSGMKPLEVEGNRGLVYMEDSKALFKKIDCLKAGESTVFRVRAEALAPGNQKVQAMLQSSSEDVSLLSEETTYCYSRRSSSSRNVDEAGAQALTAERTDSISILK